MLGSSRKNSKDEEAFQKIQRWISFLAQKTVGAGPVEWSQILNEMHRMLPVKNLSVYALQERVALYVMLGSSGPQPMSLSFSVDSIFLNFIKENTEPVLKESFTKNNFDEIRKHALLFYQQSGSNGVVPIRHHEDVVGLFNFSLLDDVNREERTLFFSILSLLTTWMAQQLSWESLSQQKEKFAELARVKNELISNVTHELKTPLNGILGLTEGLLDGTCGEPGPQWCETIRVLQNLGKNLDKTVGGILDLVTIEARRHEAPRERVGLVQLIRETEANLHDLIARKGSIFHFPVLPESEIYVYGVVEQLRTVFLNLLSNACKFTDRGEIGVHLEKSGERVRVQVWDTGIGIAPQQQDLIFEEFYQEEGQHTRSFGGTGIGLAVVRKIIEMHGGFISVSSEKGRGASFLFTLPLKPG